MLTLAKVWGDVRSAAAQNDFPLAIKKLQDFTMFSSPPVFEPILGYLKDVFETPDYDNSGSFHFRAVSSDVKSFWISAWECASPESVYQGPIPSPEDVVLCLDLHGRGTFFTYCLSKPFRYRTVGKDLQWPLQGPYLIQRVAAPVKQKNS